ncbi:MAG: AraC family transcriptional regulator [Planctomycetota bacterium]
MEDDVHDVRARIEAVRRSIEDRLADEPTLDELAAEADLSPFHFHRLFRGLVGETVAAYARRLRLERAAHRVEHGERDLLVVAMDAGYASHEAFTRAFRRQFGVPPSEYRARVRGEAQPVPKHETMKIRIESETPLTVACVRHIGPYAEVGSAWKTLMKWGWSKVVFGSPQTFALCHDDPDVTEPERLRYDACMVVSAKTRPRSPVELRTLPGGRFAVTVHEGDYGSIGETYAALFARVATEEVEGHSWRLGDPPSREVYLNDPRRTKPADLRTEIWMPVAR